MTWREIIGPRITDGGEFFHILLERVEMTKMPSKEGPASLSVLKDVCVYLNIVICMGARWPGAI